MTDQQDYPLISSIALAGRESEDDVFHCIESFKSQSYPYKELIIVNNAKNQFTASSLNIKAEPDVFLLDTPTDMPAGLARAHGMAAANGQIIAQFDIDAWHAPNRLEVQAVTMAQQNANITFLSSCMQYSYISGRASYFQNERQTVLSTMMHMRQREVTYEPDRYKNEELGFLEALVEKGYRPISIPSPELYCKFCFTDGNRQNEILRSDLDKKHTKLLRSVLAARTRECVASDSV